MRTYMYVFMLWMVLFFTACDQSMEIADSNLLPANWPYEALGVSMQDPAKLAAAACGESGSKVLVCHIPPGNPDARHTICIGNPAVDHHIAHHGDYLGDCAAQPSPSPSPMPTASPNPDPDPTTPPSPMPTAPPSPMPTASPNPDPTTPPTPAPTPNPDLDNF